MFRKFAAALALMVSVILPVMYGCVSDPQAAHDKIKRTADGSETRRESSDERRDIATDSRQAMTVTVTSPKVPPATIDPAMLPEAPERAATVPGGKAAAGKDAPARFPAYLAAEYAPRMLPQPFTIKQVDRRTGATVEEITSYVVPGGTVTITTDNANKNRSSERVQRDLSVEEAWKAVREIPLAVWIGSGAFFLMGVLLLIFGGGYRMLGLPVIGVTVLGTVAIILGFTQGAILAWCIGGVTVLGGLFAMLMIWLQLRGKIRIQSILCDVQATAAAHASNVELYKRAFSQTVAGTQKFLESSAPETVERFRSVVGRKQDTDIQNLVKGVYGNVTA